MGNQPKTLKVAQTNQWVAVTASRQEEPSGPTLLVLDDEPFILQALVGFFHHTIPGAQVRSARTGAEGLAQLAQGGVDLIISDYRMPDMDGIEFLSRCAKAAPDVVRVLFTAYADPALEQLAREKAGISAFVPKGQDPILLLNAVQRAMRAIPA